MGSLLLGFALLCSAAARADFPVELNHSTNYFPKPHSIRLVTLEDRAQVEVTIDRNHCVYDDRGIPSCTAMAIDTLVVTPRLIEDLSASDGLEIYELTPTVLFARFVDRVKGRETYFIITRE
ncbi:MAG TPA: hypothetical protein VM598_07700, partial [Bdellovibrionota bacterium]|nr:hypothetical protein [Bdellovibrionota bacterium]